MAMDVQPFPRAEWQPLPFDGCAEVESQSLPRLGGMGLARLRFSPGGTIHEHAAGFDIDVICLEGEGYTSIAGESAPIRAGEWIRWPASVPHRLWTIDSPMTTLMVEHVAS